MTVSFPCFVDKSSPMNRIVQDARFGLKCFKTSAFDDDFNISRDDLINIFSDRRLLEDECFFILDTITNEITTDHGSNFREDATKLKKAFREGNTILVKRVNDIFSKFNQITTRFDEDANAYLLIAPRGGNSFDWHKDDRHVVLRLMYGEKTIIYKNKDGNEEGVVLKAGDWFSIPFGVYHRAINIGATITLVIGVLESKEWKVSNSISSEDFDREFPQY